MFQLESLRRARHMALWVLAVFLLSIGVAIASPVIQPKAMSLVCTAHGEIKMVVDDPDGAPTQVHTLDCVACLPGTVLPLADIPVLIGRTDLAYAHRVDGFEKPYWLHLIPPTARGPPSV